MLDRGVGACGYDRAEAVKRQYSRRRRADLSLVTADQALAVAREAAKSIAPGALFCDMNSVAPDTKRAAAAAIEAAGGRYVDIAQMAPVHPLRGRWRPTS